MNSNCELCKAEKLTKRYYEDNLIYVCDCKVCLCPMIVIKRHDTQPNDGENKSISKAVELIQDISFDEGKPLRKIDTNMQKIKDHWHMHLR